MRPARTIARAMRLMKGQPPPRAAVMPSFVPALSVSDSLWRLEHALENGEMQSTKAVRRMLSMLEDAVAREETHETEMDRWDPAY